MDPKFVQPMPYSPYMKDIEIVNNDQDISYEESRCIRNRDAQSSITVTKSTISDGFINIALDDSMNRSRLTVAISLREAKLLHLALAEMIEASESQSAAYNRFLATLPDPTATVEGNNNG